VLFAPEAQVAVVLRRGPSKWTQMWRWDVATDRFEKGQWIHGYLHDDSTLSPDGRYLIARVMSGDQHTVLCRPPFFTALAVTVNSLCVTGAWFLADGSVQGRLDEIRVPGCPLRIESPRQVGIRRVENFPIESTEDWSFGHDRRGRKIALHEGKIGVVREDGIRWLKDFAPYEPEDVAPPKRALVW
jgi:hypothetical protein